MASKKPHPTKTIGPIHFEDLEPHRFEDLIRQLSYEFRDWQSIEATGRGGDDDGFDIRATERQDLHIEDGESAEVHPMEGNLWMIQCKRQKTVTPSQIKAILKEVDEQSPPYGYILAAPANFSKRSHDTFREQLRAKGVREFYVWGKAALEDLLFQPRNDRILFAFFGISLATRRRSKITQVRSVVTTKNKLYKVLGEPQASLHREVLIRAIDADHYPFEEEYDDFDTLPRWKKRVVVGHHPVGLKVHVASYHTYIDREKKEWDYSALSNMADRPDDHDEFKAWADNNARVEDAFFATSRSNIGVYDIYGLLPYEDILLVDPEGDRAYHMPHIYTTFYRSKSPYLWTYATVSIFGEYIDVDESWKRTSFFPEDVPSDRRLSKEPSDQNLDVNPRTLENLVDRKNSYDTLFFDADVGIQASVGDVFALLTDDDPGDQVYVRATFVGEVHFGTYVDNQKNPWAVRTAAREQLEREPTDEEKVQVVEIEFAYAHQWNPASR